jgi:hypothetical protein
MIFMRQDARLGVNEIATFFMPRESPFAIVLSKEERVTLEAQARQYTSPYCVGAQQQ